MIYKCVYDDDNGNYLNKCIAAKPVPTYGAEYIQITELLTIRKDGVFQVGNILPILGGLWHWEKIGFNDYLKLL